MSEPTSKSLEPVISTSAPQGSGDPAASTTAPQSRRAVALLARMFFCVIVVVNLTAGATIWLSKAQAISQSAANAMPGHIARIESLLQQQDLLDPATLSQLSAQLAATQQDLQHLQNALPVTGELGLGTAGGSEQALQLGVDMVITGENLVAAAQVLRPDLIGLAQSVVQGPSGPVQSGQIRPNISDIEAAQRSIATAKQSWQQALSQWHAYAGSVPDLSSPVLNEILREMGLVSNTLTVALSTTSSVLDWSQRLLGLKAPNSVLLVEENPDVLRPTGGSITHYAVLTFTNGGLTSRLTLHPISSLDCPHPTCATSSLPRVATWIPVSNAPVRVEDANLDPDLGVSGWSIYNHFVQEGGPPVSGVIVATDNVFADLLAVTGPVIIPGVAGTFTASNAIQRIRALRATMAQGATPRDIDALMLSALLASLKSATSAQLSQLGHTLLRALVLKDVQLFATNDGVENSLIQSGSSGQVESTSSDSLEIVDTNVSGAPVNQFIAETALDKVSLDSLGNAQHDLTLTYHYVVPVGSTPSRPYTDVVRVIVPNETRSESITGPCAPIVITQAFHGVLACKFTEAPGRVMTIHFSWQVPLVREPSGPLSHAYSLLVQRQPGSVIDVAVSVSAPPGNSFADVALPGHLVEGKLTFSVSPLLYDTTLQASLH